MKGIADIRQDYRKAILTEEAVGDDPVQFFEQWFGEAQKAEITEVNAMTLATVKPDNTADARIVLLKGIADGTFLFYTNYNSAKGLSIEKNPHVSLVFFWKELERQVRICGTAAKTSRAVSEKYFHSRPVGSQIGALASPQSQIIADRLQLDNDYLSLQQEYQNKTIPCPNHWGGYAVSPVSVEFWQGRSSRIHDRIQFTLTENNTWAKVRLAP